MQGSPHVILPHLAALLAPVLALLGGAALAAPVVLGDSGKTYSLAPYLADVKVERRTGLRKSPSQRRRAAAKASGIGLPVHTPQMRSGTLPAAAPSAALSRRLKRLAQPLFLVGADARSLQWLRRNRGALAAHGALGYLVEGASEADLAAVRRAGVGLTIMPSSAAMLAEVLGLTHYPVLLSAKGIEQ